MINIGNLAIFPNPNLEVDILFGTGEKPTFISLVWDKQKCTVQISFLMTDNDDIEPDFEKAVEVISMEFNNINDATNYYNAGRIPINVNKILREYLDKG